MNKDSQATGAQAEDVAASLALGAGAPKVTPNVGELFRFESNPLPAVVDKA